jgi:hypothetical protein
MIRVAAQAKSGPLVSSFSWIVGMKIRVSPLVLVAACSPAFAGQVSFQELDQMIHLASTLVVGEIEEARMPSPERPFDYQFVQIKKVVRGKLIPRKITVRIQYPYRPGVSFSCPASGLESTMTVGKMYLLLLDTYDPKLGAYNQNSTEVTLVRTEPLEAREQVLRLWKS